ncbi:MAG: glycosidase, partial [Candidatus Bipolaricaulia bacterium]
MNFSLNNNPREIFVRYGGNPILKAEEWPYVANSVFNPGATKLDGETVLLCRVEDCRGFSHLTVARSQDGKTGWKVDGS